jgi:hypothetical protein
MGKTAWSQKVFGMRLGEKRMEKEKVAGRYIFYGIGLLEGT